MMVDDDRMPLAAASSREQLRVRFRTLGCYPLTGRGREHGDDRRGDRRGDARVADLRAPGPRDRPRRRRLDGEQEAGGLLLSAVREQSLLRFITCGSVDDGKTTLIGRLLHESKLIFDDQLAALAADSRRVGTARRARLRAAARRPPAEREQGITIDVAYRYFSTAAAPLHRRRHARPRAVHAQHGHRRLDRRLRRDPDRRAQGRARQTRRHCYLVALLGIRHVALAINKMDLVEHSEERYREIEAAYREFAARDRPARRHLHPGLRAGGRQRRRAERAHALVRRADADGLPRDGRGRPRPHGGRAVPDAGPVGEPARARTSAASPARSPAARSAPATRSACSRATRAAGSSGS